MILVGKDLFEAFQMLSYDSNPLHTKKKFAVERGFTDLVFYGMGTALLGLGYWAKERPIRLKRLRAQFMAPVLLNESLEFIVKEELEKGKVKIGARDKDGNKLASIGIEYVLTASHTQIESKCFSVLENSRDLSIEELNIARVSTLQFDLNRTGIENLKKFGLHWEQLPTHQWNAFAWPSYLVGMDVPGKEALLGLVDITFSDNNPSHPWLNFDAKSISICFDNRFNSLLIKAENDCFTKIKINSFYGANRGI